MQLCRNESPLLRYTAAQFSLKNEDEHLICPHLPLPTCQKQKGCRSCWSVFLICDGHNGNQASNFIKERLLDELARRLPKHIPSYKIFDTSDGQLFTWRVKKALHDTFRAIDREWGKDKKLSGSTLTVVLTIGWLVTVANVGDSFAYLHCYGNKYNLSGNHRLSDNESEKARLEKAGVLVAGVTLDNKPPQRGDTTVGPLRAWPGGLMMSRSIGDIDASSEVHPFPHIKQVVIPAYGARLVLASDGLWDSLDARKALSLSKNKPIDQLAAKLLARAAKAEGGQLTDDTTIIVLDILCANNPVTPEGHMIPQHPETTKSKGAIKAFKRFVGASADVEHQLEFVADSDSMDEFPADFGTRKSSLSFDDQAVLSSVLKEINDSERVASRVGSSNNLELIGSGPEDCKSDSWRNKRTMSLRWCQQSLLTDDNDTSSSLESDGLESPSELNGSTGLLNGS